MVIAGASVLVLVGFGFKVSMAPLHFWAPDVYEGAPTPITAFLSTASKLAGFVALIRLLIAAFPAVQAEWTSFVAIAAAVTMTVGNLIAISQKNIKRLLAYSSVAHAGYALIGVAAASVLGVTSVIYYFLAYVVTNLAGRAGGYCPVMMTPPTIRASKIQRLTPNRHLRSVVFSDTLGVLLELSLFLRARLHAACGPAYNPKHGQQSNRHTGAQEENCKDVVVCRSHLVVQPKSGEQGYEQDQDRQKTGQRNCSDHRHIEHVLTAARL